MSTPLPSPVAARETDRDAASLIELTVAWGDRVLRVHHLPLDRTFTVSRDTRDATADLCVDGSEWPRELNSWVLIHRGSRGPVARVAPGARWSIERDESSDERDPISPERDAEGALCVALVRGVRVRCSLGGLELAARVVKAPRRALRSTAWDRTLLVSALGACLALSTLFAFARHSAAQGSSVFLDSLDESRASLLADFVARQREWSVTTPVSAEGTSLTRSPNGARPGPLGATGAYEAPRRRARSAVRNRGWVPQLARTRAREIVAERGIFAGLGPAFEQRAAGGPEDPFGADRSSGPDDRDAWGTSDTGDVADAFGYGGLGRLLPSAGAGGGGLGMGSTCDDFCAGNGLGLGFGTGAYIGMRGLPTGRIAERQTRGPRVTAAPMSLSSGYPAEAIRRVVLRNMGQVQHCYEQALGRAAERAGRVAVRFVIGPTGAVLASAVSDNSTGDALLGACVASAFNRWTFPAPNTVVTVTYPVLLRVD